MSLTAASKIAPSAETIQKRLRSFASREKAKLLQGFFKTGPGEYGEGDKFLGVMVPQTRLVVKEFRDAPLPEVAKLLRSTWHEDRVLALLILVSQFERGDEKVRKTIFALYLKHTKYINNWDLVDLSAPRIVGPFMDGGSRALLYRLVRSKNLWERRIAILATSFFIRKGEFADTLALSEMLLNDNEDLMHKAVGWMLREVGKKEVAVLEAFLGKHKLRMPRTALRYAIERFPEAKRKSYLKKE
ncbi:MAG: DNA alkylation repair protein [Nitrospiraceae bacterium]|nr:DNA alkylation repair protein [Nitrospiraceae bacterium]